MTKLLLLLVVCAMTGLGVAAPVQAESAGEIPTGPGCTLNPFDHTWRCIDFSKCKTLPDGTRDCPVTTGTYATGAASVGSASAARGLSRFR